MTKFCQITIKIENLGKITPYFAYNENTTFEDLLEFIAYYYPDKNICPCFKFKGQYENIALVNLENNWLFKPCINKFSYFIIENRDPKKQCHCFPEYKEYYRKSKKYIINEIYQKNNNSLNSIEIDNLTGKIIAKENLNKKVNFTDFYDVIIDIKSIKDISRGWEIKMSKEGEKQYEKYKKENGIIKIGVIGNSNKGKTFLLSKLSKMNMPSGTSIRTEGLSIKYPKIDEVFKNRNIVLLDSAGLETPVLKEENNINNSNNNEISNEISNEINNEINNEVKNEIINENFIENDDSIENEKNKCDKKSEKELFREKSREKLITELFLQNYIIYNSDILITVVGIMTYSEQKLLSKIKSEIQKAKINKDLFIIHNLITFTTVEQVKEYIDNFLMKSASFNLEKRNEISTEVGNNKNVYFYEKNSFPKIYHLIFANEGSEAGLHYNKFTLNFIENGFQRVTDLKPYDAIETVKKRFVEMSKDILDKMEVPLQMEDFDNNIDKKQSIKLNKSRNVILKKCLIDELGFSNLRANGFEPVYNFYKKENKIIVRVEAPGNCNIIPEIDYEGEITIIRLNGVKKKDKEPQNLEENLFNSREFGNFSLDIPLKTDDYLINKNEEPNIIEQKGIFIIEYNLDERRCKNKGYIIKKEEEI